MSDYAILQELLELAHSATSADHATLVLHEQADSLLLFAPADVVVDFGLEDVADSGVRIDETTTGSNLVTYVPIVGPAGDAGWIAVMQSADQLDPAAAMDVVSRVAHLVEERLDRQAEQVRLDELGDLLRSNQERLHVTRDELSLSNQELEQFAYIAAHELVAPLRAVAVYAEVLESVTPVSGVDAPSAARNCVNEIRAGVQQMTRQVQALLELSNNELDAESATPLDIGEIVRAALDTMAQPLDEVGAVLHIDDELPTVIGTAVPLQSVFANLFSNAVRYRTPDTQLQIWVTSRPIADGFRVEVADNGTGVAEIDQARIFQMFERASTSEDGSGIGLALSRKILNRFGATIGVEPGDPLGSVFWIEFPAVGAL